MRIGGYAGRETARQLKHNKEQTGPYRNDY
jgi:hypothetical protein